MAGDDPCVHMEEDVILTQDFKAKIEAAIAERPHEAIQFFSMRKADVEVGSRYDNTFTGNLCFYLPAGYSRYVRDYHNEWPDRLVDLNGYDLMMRAWLKSRKERYWVHIPSLVEHRVAKSVIDPRRSSKRQSFTFEDPVPNVPKRVHPTGENQ